jgi:hypothetical protein
MNIFILDESPVLSAQLQCDKHIVKMLLESAQMLSTAHRMLDGVESKRPSKSGKRMVPYYTHSDGYLEGALYKAVHFHHPCTVWTMETSGNYDWHYTHFVALCDEYKYRYGKKHLTDTKLGQTLCVSPTNIPAGPLTKQPLAMKANPECMSDDVVQSYRAFYQTKQARFNMVWTKRPVPEWFQIAA